MLLSPHHRLASLAGQLREMAADAALKVVKQIQALADGPKTPEMRDCLGHVVSSLQFFLDHPDSRVRTSSARAMLKLASGYTDDFRRLDLTKTSAAHARAMRAASEGDAEQDVQDLGALLTEILQAAGVECSAPAVPRVVARSGEASAPVGAAASSSTAVPSSLETRGEVVLRVSDPSDGKIKGAILESVVKVNGVVSVTVEGAHIVVNTRSTAVAADAGFLADLLTSVKAQGAVGIQLVTSSTAPSAAAGPSYLEPSGAADDDEDDAEPAYLDDDEDELADDAAGEPGGRPGGGLGGQPQQWSFFSQNNWMTGRRVQEFNDDPTIVARLAKAKEREEERKRDEAGRIGRFAAWWGGR